ncbi:type II toxin-antitoxin system PemK/MazF family toxin [bacterium CPR1]|nr:type II toxin-antitoxin system PemK/MazF family toxin [bacterium CPR1]
MPDPRRGEIWLVGFDPSVGTEIRKVRPALIVSNDSANRNASKVTLLPITSTVRSIPILVLIDPHPQNGLDRPSSVRVPDVCTFDKARLKRPLGRLTAEQMTEVSEKLAIHLGL